MHFLILFVSVLLPVNGNVSSLMKSFPVKNCIKISFHIGFCLDYKSVIKSSVGPKKNTQDTARDLVGSVIRVKVFLEPCQSGGC